MTSEQPRMPEGYYPLRASDGHYILLDTGTGMQRLKDGLGRNKRFGSPEAGVEYARRHKAAGLRYDEELGV